MGFAEAIVLAFIGGILLNLMPCVLPVLAVKVTALASMGDHSRGQRLRHGLGYAAGIIASMLALAAGVIGLKLAGETVGWGFQFQQPLFVVALAAVMVLFALNLFSVFEIGVPKSAARLGAPPQTGDRRSFFEGILAVVLATPCTAPFMGTAIGFAMASHPMVIISVFVALGAGLAAPFVAVALVPAFYKVIPKPGPWMGVMKRVLGFALLLTAVWLIWLFGRLMGPDAVTGLLVFLVGLSFAAWIYGEVQYRPWDKTKAVAIGFAIAGVSVAGWLGIADLEMEPPSGTEVAAAVDGEELADDEIAWSDWTPTIVDDTLAEGRPVFVNFTADWCINCKANEREVIATPPVIAAAREADIEMVMADLTHTEDELVQELEKYGRAGVPLYLLFSPDDPDEPEILPQVLTRDRMVDSFESVR